jgi:hypothetical protein
MRDAITVAYLQGKLDRSDGEEGKRGPFSADAAEELYNRIDGEIGSEK